MPIQISTIVPAHNSLWIGTENGVLLTYPFTAPTLVAEETGWELIKVLDYELSFWLVFFSVEEPTLSTRTSVKLPSGPLFIIIFRDKWHLLVPVKIRFWGHQKWYNWAVKLSTCFLCYILLPCLNTVWLVLMYITPTVLARKLRSKVVLFPSRWTWRWSMQWRRVKWGRWQVHWRRAPTQADCPLVSGSMTHCWYKLINAFCGWLASPQL